MWYDRIVVAAPLPWYWIVAIAIFTMAFVCGFLICACNHNVEWRNIFTDKLMRTVTIDTEKRVRMRDISNKKNFGPSKALVHRFSKADLRRSKTPLPPDPRMRIGQDPRVGVLEPMPESPTKIVVVSAEVERETNASKNWDYPQIGDGRSNSDHLNGNADPSFGHAQYTNKNAAEDNVEMTSFANGRHLLSIDDNQNQAVDSASLITAYSQEYTVPSSEPTKRRTKGFVGKETDDDSAGGVFGGPSAIGAAGFGAYDNKGATFGDESNIQAGLEPESGASRADPDTLTLSSRSTSLPTSPQRGDRGSIDSGLQAQPLLGIRRQSEDPVNSNGYALAGSEERTGNLPPIDSTSSWASSPPASQIMSPTFPPRGEVTVAPPMNDQTTPWASTVPNNRPVSAKTKWSDETSSDMTDNEMALDDCDFTSDTYSVSEESNTEPDTGPRTEPDIDIGPRTEPNTGPIRMFYGL